MTQLVLRELRLGDENAFRTAVREFCRTDPDWEFGFHFDEATDFAEYVAQLRRERDGVALPEGWVPHTFLVAWVGDRIVGRVSLRHELSDFLREYGGHIGFGVVGAHRRRGCGTEMLRQTLPWAKCLGIDRVLLTCDEHNVPSIKVIESCGGALEDKRDRPGGGTTRRYWIQL